MVRGIIQKNNFKVLLTGGIILLLVIFGSFQYIDKQRYIKYMSNELANDIANMNRHILMNDDYLTRILETKELSYDDANFLMSTNGMMLGTSAKYNSIAKDYLSRADRDGLSNTFTNTASSFNHYFSILENSYFDESDILKLDSKKLEQLKVMKEINDIWLVEVKKHLSSLNNDLTTEEQIQMLNTGGNFKIYDENRIIAQQNWVTLLRELSRKTEQHLKKEFPNINHDLSDFMIEDLYKD